MGYIKLNVRNHFPILKKKKNQKSLSMKLNLPLQHPNFHNINYIIQFMAKNSIKGAY